MKEYHKIQTLFKRDEKTKQIIMGDWSLLEFQYLSENPWDFTEKVDGTNIRIHWNKEKVLIGGKTNDAQLHVTLIDKINEALPPDKFKVLYPNTEMTLYAEGYGNKIQSKGKLYKPDGVDFILFDVMINGFWLERMNILDIGNKLGIQVVPLIGDGTLWDMVDRVSKGFDSIFGGFTAEGIVAKPVVSLCSRRGERLIAKLKYKDFTKGVIYPHN